MTAKQFSPISNLEVIKKSYDYREIVKELDFESSLDNVRLTDVLHYCKDLLCGTHIIIIQIFKRILWKHWDTFLDAISSIADV
jgi:hypothetical protein